MVLVVVVVVVAGEFSVDLPDYVPLLCLVGGRWRRMIYKTNATGTPGALREFISGDENHTGEQKGHQG